MPWPFCTCQDLSAHVTICPHMPWPVRTCEGLSSHVRKMCQPVRASVRQTVTARLSQATSEFTQENLSSLHFEKSTIGRLQNTKNQCQWLNIKWRNRRNLRKNAGQARKNWRFLVQRQPSSPSNLAGFKCWYSFLNTFCIYFCIYWPWLQMLYKCSIYYFLSTIHR